MFAGITIGNLWSPRGSTATKCPPKGVCLAVSVSFSADTETKKMKTTPKSSAAREVLARSMRALCSRDAGVRFGVKDPPPPPPRPERSCGTRFRWPFRRPHRAHNARIERERERRQLCLILRRFAARRVRGSHNATMRAMWSVHKAGSSAAFRWPIWPGCGRGMRVMPANDTGRGALIAWVILFLVKVCVLHCASGDAFVL